MIMFSVLHFCKMSKFSFGFKNNILYQLKNLYQTFYIDQRTCTKHFISTKERVQNFLYQPKNAYKTFYINQRTCTKLFVSTKERVQNFLYQPKNVYKTFVDRSANEFEFYSAKPRCNYSLS